MFPVSSLSNLSMADFPPTSSSSDTPVMPAASSSALVDDAFEDACSICLDPFSDQDPATVTSCRHEYHLHCILDWSQRSKECPICWRLLVLKDPATQELLAAVESERLSRSRNLHNSNHDFDVEQDSSYSDDSDFDERIMQHLAAASSRARYVRSRGRLRSSGIGPSQVLVFSTPANAPTVRQTLPSSPERQNLHSVLSNDDLPNSGESSDLNVQPLLSVVPPVVNLVSSPPFNRDGPFKPRVQCKRPSLESSQIPGPSEISLSESFKSKWSAASARYKESISKGTRGLKEKLLARNNSVKELSKGVQREMSAGIAGFARMIERLDINSKRTVAPSPVYGCPVGASNFNCKGKNVQENYISETLDKSSGETADNVNSNATLLVHGTN